MIARKYENSSQFVVATHHILIMSSSTDKISFIFTVMLRPVIKIIQRLYNVPTLIYKTNFIRKSNKSLEESNRKDRDHLLLSCYCTEKMLIIVCIKDLSP